MPFTHRVDDQMLQFCLHSYAALTRYTRLKLLKLYLHLLYNLYFANKHLNNHSSVEMTISMREVWCKRTDKNSAVSRYFIIQNIINNSDNMSDEMVSELRLCICFFVYFFWQCVRIPENIQTTHKPFKTVVYNECIYLWGVDVIYLCSPLDFAN